MNILSITEAYWKPKSVLRKSGMQYCSRETIENSENYINQSDEAVKQVGESKAFVRLAAKIKKRFPRLRIIITADGLYVTKKVLQICKDYHWDYIIRYKEGSASSIAEECRALSGKRNRWNRY